MKPAKKVSERMRKVRSRGTGLEGRMERILADIGVRYEVQPDLPGHPDFRIARTKILVFCDSSFWHGRRTSDTNGTSFKKNRTFWMKKLAYNKKRDLEINKELRQAGWKVLRFWDTTILRRPDFVVARITEAFE